MSKLASQIKIFICLSLFLLPQIAQGAQVTIKAQVDRTEVKLGDSLQMQVIVQGTQKTSQPQIPKTNAFDLSYHGERSQFNMVNTTMTSSVTYSYTIFPLKKGQLTIGPIYVNYKGKKIKTKPVKIRVLPADANTQEAEPLILMAKVSNPSPYYNQQIIYTMQLARRVEVVNSRLELPEFKDFWVEDLGKQREAQRVIGGYTYVVTELRKALFPNKTGPLQIKPVTIHCEVVLPRRRDKRRSRDPFLNRFFQDSFFSFRHRTASKTLRSPTLKIEVKPLPEAGKPANFHPLVGKIKLKSDLSKKKLEAGDSSTLTITASGNANIRDANLTEPETIDNFKIYDDKPSLKFIPKENGLIGEKTFKKALVPLKAGQPQTPVYTVPYFDPASKRYKVASTKPISLLVKASAEKENLHLLGSTSGAVPKKEIKILGKDILTVSTHPNALENEQLSSTEHTIYTVLFLLSPGIFLGLLSVRTKSKFYQKNAAILRKKKALKLAEKKIKPVSSLTSNATEFYPQAAKIIKEYLGDKLNLSGGALTSQEIHAKLKIAGVEEELINQLTALMEQCEFCQFASSNQDQSKCQDILKNVEQLLTQLEKHL